MNDWIITHIPNKGLVKMGATKYCVRCEKKARYHNIETGWLCEECFEE